MSLYACRRFVPCPTYRPPIDRSFASKRERPHIANYHSLPEETQRKLHRIVGCERIAHCLTAIGEERQARHYVEEARRERQELHFQLPSTQEYLKELSRRPIKKLSRDEVVQIAESFAFSHAALMNDGLAKEQLDKLSAIYTSYLPLYKELGINSKN
jgi:hypothetical protein